MNLADAIRRALTLMQAGRQAESIALCQRVLAVAPGQPDALHLLALAARDRDDPAAAEHFFQRALSAAPRRADILVNYGNFLFARGRAREARSKLTKAVKSQPGSASAWYHLGLLSLRTGELREARRCAVRATTLAPEYPAAWELLAAVQQKTGDTRGAIATCRRGIGHQANAPRLHYSLGQLLREECEFEAAAVAYESALEKGHTTPDAYRNLAEAWLEAGHPDEAMAAADRGVQQFPDHAPLHRIRARMRWELEAAGDPLQGLRQSARDHPRNPDLWRALVELLNLLERRDEARDVLAEALAAGCPETPELRLLAAVSLADSGHAEEATRAFEALNESCADHPDIKLAYAQHALSNGDPGLAEKLCGEVLQLTPLDQLALAYLGTAWQLQQDPREQWLLDYQRMIRQVEVPPPAGYADGASFFAALAEVLTSLHRTRAHPIDQTLRGGTQTNGFLFRLKHPLLRELEAQIRVAVREALSTFPCEPEHPFWGRRPRGDGVRFSGAWSVRLSSAGYHTNHVHPMGWMSSALYVALPDEVRSSESRAGYIQFGVPLLDKDPGLPPRRVIRPEVGTVVLFPSYMWHGTIPFRSQQPRLTVAFDLLPEPTRGGAA
ncbi:MAG TPA: tetratricopeptide repeat protein [Pseudomonadales bacterium]